VTGVALITFIILAVNDPLVQVQLLVWIFVIARSDGDFLRCFLLHQRKLLPRAATATVAKMDFEGPLTSLVWLTSVVSIAATYLVSSQIIPDLGGEHYAVVEAFFGDHLRYPGGGGYPRTGQGVYFDELAARARGW